jgi:DNA helicase-2/ATP-dependent DNA helicase PcrA
MYVAITRARRRLYLSFSQTRMLHGQTRYNMRSRFLDELPEESLKWLSPQTKPGWFRNKKAAWDENPSSGANQIAARCASRAVRTMAGVRGKTYHILSSVKV